MMKSQPSSADWRSEVVASLRSIASPAAVVPFPRSTPFRTIVSPHARCRSRPATRRHCVIMLRRWCRRSGELFYLATDGTRDGRRQDRPRLWPQRPDAGPSAGGPAFLGGQPRRQSLLPTHSVDPPGKSEPRSGCIFPGRRRLMPFCRASATQSVVVHRSRSEAAVQNDAAFAARRCGTTLGSARQSSSRKFPWCRLHVGLRRVLEPGPIPTADQPRAPRRLACRRRRAPPRRCCRR